MSAAGPPSPELIAALTAEPLPWENRQANILGILITLMVLLWIPTIGRLYTRLFIVKKPWWDDFFVVFAVLWFTACSITICVMTNYGLGQHALLISLDDLQNVLLGQYIFGICYAASTSTIKISLLLQYLRVYESGTWTYRFTQLVLVITSLWGFALTFISIFVCFPSPAAFWKMQPRGCYGFAATDLDELTGTVKGHSASNFALDVTVLMLAIRLQFLDKAPTKKKSAAVLLVMGITACAFALWRLVNIIETGGGVGIDPTWNLPGPGLLSQVEVFLAALVATIPFFWPVVMDGWHKIFVQYDFSVSEARIQDDEYELAQAGDPPAGRGKNGVWLEESSEKNKAGKKSKSGSHLASNFFAGGTTSQAVGDKPSRF